jgi:Ca2+-binding EF-hand superfamily protein
MTSHDDRVRYFDTFQRHDLEKNGRLNADQLMAALKDLGCASEAAGVEHLLRRYDADGSHSIDFGEFLELLANADAAPDSGAHTRRERSP